MAVRWKFNPKAFEQLRNDPKLIGAMESAAQAASAGTGFAVRVVGWRHHGRRAGGRTSVQIWSERGARGDPDGLVRALARTSIPLTRKSVYVTKAGRVRSASSAQVDHWTRGAG